VAPEATKREPAKVRLYGLMTVTRRGYLTQVGFAAVLLVALLGVWAMMPPLPPELRDAPMSSAGRIVIGLLGNVPWLVLALAVLLVIEVIVVLGRFRRLEAERPGK
jgi:hypothetical protein